MRRTYCPFSVAVCSVSSAACVIWLFIVQTNVLRRVFRTTPEATLFAVLKGEFLALDAGCTDRISRRKPPDFSREDKAGNIRLGRGRWALTSAAAGVAQEAAGL